MPGSHHPPRVPSHRPEEPLPSLISPSTSSSTTLLTLPSIALHGISDYLSVLEVAYLGAMTSLSLTQLIGPEYWSQAIKQQLALFVPAKAYFDGPAHYIITRSPSKRSAREFFPVEVMICEARLEEALTAAGLKDLAMDWTWDIETTPPPRSFEPRRLLTNFRLRTTSPPQ